MEQRHTILHGCGQILKRRSRQYFALTMSHNKAHRLEIFEDEMSWRNNKKIKQLLDLTDLICVDELHRSQPAHGIGLYLETGFYGIAFIDNAQKQKWSDELNLVAQRNRRTKQYPSVEHVFQGKMKFKPKSLVKSDVPGDGSYRICYTSSQILIFNTSILSPTLLLECDSISSLSTHNSVLKMTSKSSSPIGECDILIRLADSVEAKYSLQRYHEIDRFSSKHPQRQQKVDDLFNQKINRVQTDNSRISEESFQMINEPSVISIFNNRTINSLISLRKKNHQGASVQDFHKRASFKGNFLTFEKELGNIPETTKYGGKQPIESSNNTTHHYNHEENFNLGANESLRPRSFSDTSRYRREKESANHLSSRGVNRVLSNLDQQSPSRHSLRLSLSRSQYAVVRSPSTGFFLPTKTRVLTAPSSFNIIHHPNISKEEYMDMSGNR